MTDSDSSELITYFTEILKEKHDLYIEMDEKFLLHISYSESTKYVTIAIDSSIVDEIFYFKRNNLDLETNLTHVFENMILPGGKLRKSKFTGKVYDSDEKLENDEKFEIMKLKFIKKEIPSCSVCFEYTIRETACNHSLCYDCFRSLKKRTCPICRAQVDRCEHEDE